MASNPEEGSNTTLIAIDRDRNSQRAVKWAVDNLLQKNSSCTLIHVRTKTFNPRRYPSQFLLIYYRLFKFNIYLVICFHICSCINKIRFIFWFIYADDSDAIPKQGRSPTQEELHQLFLPFRGFCARKGVSKMQC